MQVKTKIPICTRRKRMEVTALFDTGARATFISEDLGKELGFEKVESMSIPLAVKGKFGEVVGKVATDIIIEGWRLPYTALVMKDLNEDAVIGTSFMEQYGIELSLDEGAVKLEKRPPDLGGLI